MARGHKSVLQQAVVRLKACASPAGQPSARSRLSWQFWSSACCVVSSGIVTVDTRGAIVWSFDDPALQLSIAGYQIRRKQTCTDARRSVSMKWLALAPLQPASVGAFRLYRVAGDGAEPGYTAEPSEPYPARQIKTQVGYRPLDNGGLLAIVLQRWSSSRWRTFRYALHPTDARRPRPRKIVFAPCAQDAASQSGQAN